MHKTMIGLTSTNNSLSNNACWSQYHELATEAYYLLAIVYDKLGQLEEREEASDSFKKHIEALENPQDEVDPLLNLL